MGIAFQLSGTFEESVIEFRRPNSRIKIQSRLAESSLDPSPSTLSKSQALKRNECSKRTTSHEPPSQHGMVSHHTEN